MRRYLASGLVACGWVLLAVGCSKKPESRTTQADTIAETDSSITASGIITAKVEYRNIPCEDVAVRKPIQMEVGADGGVLWDGPDSLVVAPGVVPNGRIYVFTMQRNGGGEVSVNGTPKGGGEAEYLEPTRENDPKFKLKIDYSVCKSSLPGMALAQDKTVIVLPIEIEPYRSLTAELEHLSTYAVAAPGYTSKAQSLQMAPAPVRGGVPDTMHADTAGADSSAR